MIKRHLKPNKILDLISYTITLQTIMCKYIQIYRLDLCEMKMKDTNRSCAITLLKQIFTSRFTFQQIFCYVLPFPRHILDAIDMLPQMLKSKQPMDLPLTIQSSYSRICKIPQDPQVNRNGIKSNVSARRWKKI